MDAVTLYGVTYFLVWLVIAMGVSLAVVATMRKARRTRAARYAQQHRQFERQTRDRAWESVVAAGIPDSAWDPETRKQIARER